MNQLNYKHNDVESCKKPSSSVKTVEFLLRDRSSSAKTFEFLLRDRSSSAKTVEFCENRRILAQTYQSSLTRSNRCNSGRVITSVNRSNVGPRKLTFFSYGRSLVPYGRNPQTPSFRSLMQRETDVHQLLAGKM